MVKVAFFERENLKKHYTYRLLEYLAMKNGVQFCPVQEAGIILVSISFCREISKVHIIKRLNNHAKILMGGCEGYSGEPYLAFVDGVIVGEGFEFFKWLGEHINDSLSMFWEKFESLPYTLTINKLSEPIYPSYIIEWDLVIAVNVSRRNYYYLAARGCPFKCKFCLCHIFGCRNRNRIGIGLLF